MGEQGQRGTEEPGEDTAPEDEALEDTAPEQPDEDDEVEAHGSWGGAG